MWEYGGEGRGAVQDAGPEVKRRKIKRKISGVEVSKKSKGRNQ